MTARWEDVLDAQQAIWSFWQSDVGRLYAKTFGDDQAKKHTVATAGGDVPASKALAAEVSRKLYQGEHLSFATDIHLAGTERNQEWGDRRVRDIQETTMFHADPIAIEPDMWTLIEAAQREFQPEPLRETDLITEAGFILLPRPILAKDIWNKTVSYRAIAWMPMIRARPVPESPAIEAASELMGWNQEQYGIWLSLYTHIADPDDWMSEDKASKAGMMGFPDLTLAHQTPWQFGRDYASGKPEQFSGMHDGSFYTENGVNWPEAIENYINTMRTIQATLRLLQQTIAVHRQHRPDRATRRRAARLAYPEKEVTVVYLRRPRDDSYQDREPGEGKTVEWTHRWIVSGHWRNQYYPSLGEHRQIWINPFIKGPEDQPLRIRERRAFLLQR